jgi:hypothetical protein
MDNSVHEISGFGFIGLEVEEWSRGLDKISCFAEKRANKSEIQGSFTAFRMTNVNGLCRKAVRASRECPHLKIEIWGTHLCGGGLELEVEEAGGAVEVG